MAVSSLGTFLFKANQWILCLRGAGSADCWFEELRVLTYNSSLDLSCSRIIPYGRQAGVP